MKKILSYVAFITIMITGYSYANEAPTTEADTNIEEAQSPYNDTGAIILLFHRFGEDKHPLTNIRLKQLDMIIAYLKDNSYTVLPLNQIIKATKLGAKLPPKTVAITIDDAFKSTYTQAYPRFKTAGFPFTVFASTGNIDNNNPNYVTWANISEMHEDGVSIQNHTVNHPYLVGMNGDALLKEIENSQNAIKKITGKVPALFSYPYGEASSEVFDVMEPFGFEAQFGQHSGVVNQTSNMRYLPRFSINEKYGTLKRLKLVLNTKPLPVKMLEPINPLIKSKNPPQIRFTVGDSIKSLKNLNCYHSGVGKVNLVKNKKTVSLNFPQTFKKGRTRINCTMPHPTSGYRWYGMQYIVK